MTDRFEAVQAAAQARGAASLNTETLARRMAAQLPGRKAPILRNKT
jgi:hypothetical protein